MDLNGGKTKKPQTTREYLPPLSSFLKEERPEHGTATGKVAKRFGKGYNKQRKLGKKLWREYYKSIEFINKF